MKRIKNASSYYSTEWKTAANVGITIKLVKEGNPGILFCQTLDVKYLIPSVKCHAYGIYC